MRRLCGSMTRIVVQDLIAGPARAADAVRPPTAGPVTLDSSSAAGATDVAAGRRTGRRRHLPRRRDAGDQVLVQAGRLRRRVADVCRTPHTKATMYLMASHIEARPGHPRPPSCARSVITSAGTLNCSSALDVIESKLA